MRDLLRTLSAGESFENCRPPVIPGLESLIYANDAVKPIRTDSFLHFDEII